MFRRLYSPRLDLYVVHLNKNVARARLLRVSPGPPICVASLHATTVGFILHPAI